MAASNDRPLEAPDDVPANPGCLRRLLRALSLVWLACMLALPLLWWATGETWWGLIFLRYAPAVPYLAPSLLIGLAALTLRDWRSLGINLLAAAIVTFGFLRPGLNFHSAVDAPRFRVMTYNVEAAVEGIEGVVQTLQAESADLVILQEASKPMSGHGPDAGAALREQFSSWSAVRGTHSKELLILSRESPLTDEREVNLGAGRAALICKTRLHGRPLRIIDVHLNVSLGGRSLSGSGWGFREYLVHTAQVRQEQCDRLVSILAESDEPTLLAGDFNSPPISVVSEILRDHLDDTFERAGLGFGLTFSSTRPLWRIDYIYASHDMRPLQARVAAVTTSDHRPLVVDFAP